MSKKKTTHHTLVLLDAHAIIHRAYHALPDFSSSKGEPTGALYGLSAMLIKLIQDLQPDYIAAAYDLPEPTYRHEVYDNYKAGRAELEGELVMQIDRSRDVFEAFSIPIYECAGFEADDVLGAIVEQVKKNPPTDGLDIVIASGDMDTLQLVDGKHVQVFTMRKGLRDTVLYDETAVRERFGFGPELLPDFKGLRGDPSDNIPGIVGIGEKTATILINEFGSIENIYTTLASSPERLEKAGIKPRIRKLLEENEEEAQFSKMLATIRRDVPIQFVLPPKKWCDTFDVARVTALFSELSFRTLAERAKTLLGISEGASEVSADSTVPEANQASEETEIVDETELFETAIALWLVDSDITNPTCEDILEWAHTKVFAEAKEKVFAELKKQKLETVFEDIERPLIPVITQMQERGIKIDRTILGKLSKNYHKELAKLEKKIWKKAGTEFNINSPRQLADVLFDRLELSVKNHKKTSTGQRSTRESELQKLAGDHPIVADILDYRELQKLLSTYIDNLPNLLDENDRLHTTFLQAGTTTGRMASHQPNLQNIPIRSDLGRAIRDAFIADDGFALAAFDYSQIELRIAAFLSGDEKLTRIFKDGGDAHTSVASEVFGVPPDKVDAEMRRRAKTINFGILYGMGVNALRANLRTSRKEAQEFLNDYFKTFTGLAHYLDKVKASAARTGYTKTLFGRRRHFEGLSSSIPYVRAAAERMAINAPIQGTEADIVKLALVRVDAFCKESGHENDAYPLLQVHDEIVYEIRKEKVDVLVPEIQRIMESVVPESDCSGVPIVVDAKIGPSWGNMKPFVQ